jgi:hypothetical protein
MTDKPPPGSMLRLTKWEAEEPLTSPTWLLTESEASDNMVYARVIVPGSQEPPSSYAADDERYPDTLLVDMREDVFEVVPEDDWPDEVCAALALWRLSQ